MALSFRFASRLNLDNPWMIRDHFTKDLYGPVVENFSTVVTHEVAEPEMMEAGKARDEGFKVDPSVPDGQTISVNWIRDVEEIVTWTESRMHLRGREIYSKEDPDKVVGFHMPRESRIRSVRLEFAAAAKAPLRFLPQKLIEAIEDETEYWADHDMNRAVIPPLVFVLLGVKEPSLEVFARSVFYIDRDSYDTLFVTAANGEKGKIRLSHEARQACLTRRFILFAPSNLALFDSQTNEKVV